MNDSLPGERFRSVQNPPKGLLGWVARMQQRLENKLALQNSRTVHVRGARVAAETLLGALLAQTRRTDYDLVVPSNQVKECEQRRLVDPILSGSRLRSIKPATMLNRRGLAELNPDLWLNLYGDQHVSFALRDFFSKRLFPTLTVQHGVSNLSHQYDRFLRSLLLPHYACDSVICTSPACRDAVRNIYDQLEDSLLKSHGLELPFKGRLDIIPLCVDTDILHPQPKEPARRRHGVADDSIVLLYLGFISQVKADLIPLLVVFAKLVRDHKQYKIRLVIAGTGPTAYTNMLQHAIRHLELVQHVTIFKDVSELSKLDLFSMSDVFVAPCDSLQESFGLTPVEAMACGVPQVVADWSGYRHTVKHGATGFLIPTYWNGSDSELLFTNELFGWSYDHILQGQAVALDQSRLYDALKLLIENSELRLKMSQESRRRAEKYYSYKAIAEQYEQLWTELHAISKSIIFKPSADRFDGPKYSKEFSHFPTRQLAADDLLVAVTPSPLPLDQLFWYAHAELHATPFLDLTLLKSIYFVAGTAQHGYTVRGLIEGSRSTSHDGDQIVRHILFLLKHGCLALAFS